MLNLKKLYEHITVKIAVIPVLMFTIVLILAFFVGRLFFNKIVLQKANQNISELNKNFEDYMYKEEKDLKKFANFLSSIIDFNNRTYEKINYYKLKDLGYIVYITDKNLKTIYPKTINKTITLDNNSVSIIVENGKSYMSIISNIKNNGKTVGYLVLRKSLSSIIKKFSVMSNQNILLLNNNKILTVERTVSNMGIPDEKTINTIIKNKTADVDIYHYKLIPLSEKYKSYIVLIFSSIYEINSVKTIFRNLSVFSLLMLILGGLLYIYGIRKVIIVRVKTLKQVLNKIAKGEIIEKLETKSTDEIGEIYKAVNRELNNLKKTAEFAKNIGEGNLNYDFTPASEKDTLGQALLTMKNDLIVAEEIKNKQKQVEEQNKWSATGRVKFADILRQNSNLKELSDNIVSLLANYLNATQVGLYIINENDPENKFVELISLFAYNRHKFLERKLEMEEGLTGACIYEKETIYLKEIPENYLIVTSGLGEAPPRNLLLIPLKLEEKVFGVIELSSLNEFKQYEIEFLESIAETIASTLNTVKVNERTTLLLEQSKQQAEELAAQEEEMRQNMEELQATQEDMQRVNEQAKQTLENMMKLATPIINVNTDKTINFVNNSAAKFANIDISDILNKKFCNIFKTNYCLSDDCIIDKVLNGENNISTKVKFENKPDREYTLYAFSIKNEYGNINAVSVQIITNI